MRFAKVRCVPPCVFITQENALFSMHLAVKTARALYLARSKLGAAARSALCACTTIQNHPLRKREGCRNLSCRRRTLSSGGVRRRSPRVTRPFWFSKCRVGCLQGASEFFSLLCVCARRTQSSRKVKIFYRILSISNTATHFRVSCRKS